MAQTLSRASLYEQTFGTRHRPSGRPVRDGDMEPLFPASEDVHPVLTKVAQRRAYAVLHEQHRTELTGLFLNELKVLKRRGVEEVAADARISLVVEEGGL